jgi:hypothetical protein
MFRRSANAGDTQASPGLDSKDHPLAGFVWLIGAALLILLGAFREQANLISTGLALLAIGVVFVPRLFRRSWIVKLAWLALAAIGVFYAVTT